MNERERVEESLQYFLQGSICYNFDMQHKGVFFLLNTTIGI
jgi:hypothetical protein